MRWLSTKISPVTSCSMVTSVIVVRQVRVSVPPATRPLPARKARESKREICGMSGSWAGVDTTGACRRERVPGGRLCE
jgi:hypothetical protein